MQGISRRLSVAPMMDWTDRHARYFLRLLAPRTWLYTEMVTTGAVLRSGDPARWLAFDPAERPLVLQLGGSEPEALAQAAAIGRDFGYDEINLNVGCPSDRVQNGRFGACLMAEPALVAACVEAMGASGLPITVKTRLGIDDQDSFDFLLRLVDQVAAAGCRSFVVHARKAWLSGLSPKENRELPPLDHARVHRLKAARPALEIIVNGGIATPGEVVSQLAAVDGVMVGRAAYQNPYALIALEAAAFGPIANPPSRHAIARTFLPYVERQRAMGTPLAAMTRHILGLFNGQPGARIFRRHLSETAHRAAAGPEVIEAALRMVPDHSLAAPCAA